MKKPKVTYSTTAYVECDRDVRVAIANTADSWAEGSENVCVNIEDVSAKIDEGEFEDEPKVKTFLKAVLKEVSGKAGDVIFHR